MILQRLHLHPFAGLADRELEFGPGLNVILGPNEAGKSTLRRALRHALLVPTRLNQREAREQVLPFLPLGGGDTVRVSLEFEVEGAAWKLDKQWARGNSASSLVAPSGGLLSDQAAVEEKLGELLGLTRGTWEHVLFAAQGEVGSSLDRLGGEEDLAELSERLRRAVFETDGVSLEALAAALESRLLAAYGRWDRERSRPEGNRGIDNPWARGAGSILAAYYERERARAAREAAESYYRCLDEVNARLSDLAEEEDTAARWIADRKDAAKDAERRGTLEAKHAALLERGKALRQVSQAWPVAEDKAKGSAARGESLRERLAALASELARAKTWDSAAQSRRRLEDAEKIAAEIVAARASLAELGPFDPEGFAELGRIEKERDRLRARLEAAALRVRFSAARHIHIETRAGVRDAVSHEIDAGGETAFSAGGRVLVREGGGAWELEVSSGEIDPAAEEARDASLADRAARLLEGLAVADLDAARAKERAVAERSQRLAYLERQLREQLGSQALEDLREETARLGGGEPPPRPLAEVAAEEARVSSELETARRELASLRQQLEGYAREHGGQDEVLDRLVSARAEEKELSEALAGLAPLPEGSADTATFLAEFRAKRERHERLRVELHRLQVEKAELAGAAPELEPAEAAELFDRADVVFARALREGESLDRIHRDFEALRTELDADTLGPWRRHLAEVLEPVTGGRYLRLAEEDEPAAEREDGLAVPLPLLSAGARASLGLAVRLSMARWFLEGRGGFLLLDDPLVDLDPERQMAAAAILRRFAEEKQVVVFTCHPSHAETLGGQILRL